jgi:LysR family transcriptional regulator (chromosome initiation inhibitor)
MDLDYDAIAVLSAVVRTGSFEAAARELNVTQSAVSQRVRVLEERYGSILVIRGRPCVPTEEARLLCQHYDQVVLMQHDLRVRMESRVGSAMAQKLLRIGVNNDSLATWFPEVVRRAQVELGLRVEVLNDDQDHTEQGLRSGNAVAAVTASERPVPGCRRTSLGSMDYLAVATPDFIRREIGPEITLTRLARAPALMFDRKDTLNEQWMMLAFGQSVALSCHMIPSFEGLIACCLGEVGWTLLPAIAALPHVAAGRLLELVPGTRVAVSLHWQAGSQHNQVIRRLTEIVADVADAQLEPDQYRKGKVQRPE